jgi:O-antigen/teichoic acid export membrane protein
MSTEAEAGYRPAQRSLFSGRVLSGTFWMALANLASRGLLMLSMLLAARLLGAAQYGEVGILLSSIAMFESVAAMGMGVTATKHIAEYRGKGPEKIPGIVALTQVSTFTAGFLACVLLYFLAPWLSAGILGNPALAEPLRIGALILLMNAMTGANQGILGGFEAFRSMALSNTLSGMATLFLVVAGTAYFGITGTLCGLAGAALLNLALSMLLVHRRMRTDRLRFTYRLGAGEFRLIFSFSLPAMLAGILIAPVNWAVGALLVNRAGYGEMGLYSAANQWFSILLFLPGVLTQVFLPILAGHGTAGKPGNLRGAVRQGITAILWAAVPLGLAVAAASPWIMGLYGPEYAGAYPLLAVIAITAAVAAAQNMLSNALAVVNRMGLHLVSNLLWAVANLALAYGLIEAGYAAMALCLAALGAYVVKLLFSLAAVAANLGKLPA